MKTIILLLSFLFLGSFAATSQVIFDIEPSQSMSITGKGPGQDAAYNPYDGSNTIAVLENLGKNPFEARIQYKGEVIEIVSIPPGEIKEVAIPKGYELYFDSRFVAKTSLIFKKGED